MLPAVLPTAPQRMRARIAELKEYRRAGVRTFADADAYDAEKRRRAQAEAAAGGSRADRANRCGVSPLAYVFVFEQRRAHVVAVPACLVTMDCGRQQLRGLKNPRRA